MLTVILETVVYLCIGLIMMMLGYWVFRRSSTSSTRENVQNEPHRAKPITGSIMPPVLRIGSVKWFL